MLRSQKVDLVLQSLRSSGLGSSSYHGRGMGLKLRGLAGRLFLCSNKNQPPHTQSMQLDDFPFLPQPQETRLFSVKCEP